jgi:serine/threonine protein kinase
MGEFAGTARFELRRRLGAGGMGVVYEAFDREQRTRVAVKALRDLDENSLYRFKNEFRALCDLRHRNLVRLGELHCEADHWFFSMELVEGTGFLSYVWGQPEPHPITEATDKTLTPPEVERIRKQRRFDESRLRSAVAQLAEAVAALHAAGKIHRDIKPSNILVAPDGRVVLLDFGLVTEVVGEQQATDVNAIGTATYMAPEQAAGHAVGPPADWYAVGTVMFEALTGVPPFDGPGIEVMMEKQRSEARSANSVARNVPADLDALCSALLQRDPALRPTGKDVLERLGAGVVAKPKRVQTQPFVGREQELEQLRAAYATARGGTGVTVFVQGESGVGKSALVRKLLDTIADEDSTSIMLSGRCYEREQVPYKAFDGIVDALSRHLSRVEQVLAAHLLPRDAAFLARVFPVLRRIPAMAEVIEPRQVPNPHEVRTRAFAALRALLAGMAERHPLILFVDDFQWADADSLALLGDLMHPPDAPPLLLVATERDPTPVPDLGDRRTIRLEPLPPAKARALAAELLGGRELSRADAIASEAGGHPLFIQELVRHAQTQHTGSVKLEEALWGRFERLEPPARLVLQAIALAGVPVTHEVASRAAGMELAAYVEWMAQLREAHFVRTSGVRGSDKVEPYHDRIREAVVGHLDDDSRRKLHRALASGLELEGAAVSDPRLLVRHLEAAGESVQAALHAERAAKLAREALAFDRAAELYRTALRLGDYDATARRQILLALGDALTHAARGPEAADALLEATPGADAATRLDCQKRAAEQLLMSGHIERGLATLDAVLAEIGVKLPSSPRAALISLLWQRAKLGLRGLRWKARDESEIASRDLMRLDVYWAVSLGLGMVDSIRGADFQVRCLLLALRTGERRRIGAALAAEGGFLSAMGKAKRARRMMAAAREVAEQTKDPFLLPWVDGGDGCLDFFEGRFADGLPKIVAGFEAIRSATSITMTWELDTLRIFRLFLLRNIGACRELSHWFGEYVRDAARRGDRYAETTMKRSSNIVWLIDDRPDEAAHDLEQASWVPARSAGRVAMPVSGDYHLQHWHLLLATSEIALYQDRVRETEARWREDFAALEKSLLLQIQFIRAESRWLRGRLELVMGRPQEARRLATKLSREGTSYGTVWGAMVRAACAHQAGNAAESAVALREAISAGEAAGMHLCAQACRDRLGAIVGGDEGAQLRAEAAKWMAIENVKNPARLIQVIAPGFDARRAAAAK